MPEKVTDAEETAAKKTKKAPRKKKSKKAAGLKLTLVKSLIGSTKRQRETVQGLGLRRIRHTVELQDTPEIRGMVTKVAHLLQVVAK